MVEMRARPRALNRDVVRRILLSLVAAIALVGIAVGFSQAQRPTERAQPGVERVYPPPGDLDLRQIKIGAILRPGYEGELSLDGAVIPESDLYREPSLYQIELRPEADSIFADLDPGRHCASIEYWPTSLGRQGAATQQWCFNLH
jgi:hypothetical protein